ncbi:Hemerythrin HHE cation binding domain protein [Kribbella flavida DSM 17836]|uniref:Hemerythrin HHE cation binding domain protein n=1 Tax=Kribbella flavida (strain DSM 17836 / JCM 10339 / NBRC 14399) TaxID=479435 RepID=D2PLQ0_KRIFD|nr:hemerythrin domain-containing protein [Kribbella flavida]ADB32480.1 Hemerythrin HHE cation binding domain protein [Kribbella flavida DSM 17836]
MPKILQHTGGDVVEVILADHRWFEEALRELRDVRSDRAAVLADLATVLVAHAEAEESKVYPSLSKKHAIAEEEVEHSEHEHDEGNEALLALMEVADTSSEEFSEKTHELSEALSHHLDEEERDVLNPARTDISQEVRDRLGEEFSAERERLIESGCGSIENVRKLVAAAKEKDKKSS